MGFSECVGLGLEQAERAQQAVQRAEHARMVEETGKKELWDHLCVCVQQGIVAVSNTTTLVVGRRPCPPRLVRIGHVIRMIVQAHD